MTETKNVGIADKKIKKNRSTGYPAINLEQATGYSAKFIEAYGKSQFNRDSAVKALGLKSVTGPSAMKVSALVHFGLLERKGNAYENSELAERIVYFTSEDEKKNAIVAAALRPKLFNALVEKYKESSIPTLLSNILVANYKINKNVAQNVAENFKDSMEYAGLCVNGIISTGDISLDQDENGKLELGGKTSSNSQAHFQSGNMLKEVSAEMISFLLPSGIVIKYPSKLAYLFNIGKFSKEIQDLDEVIIANLTSNDDGKKLSSSEE